MLVIALLVATVGSGIKIYGGVVKPIQKIVNPPAAAEKDAVKPATTDPAKSADQAKSTDQAVPEKAVPAEATAEKVSDSAVNQ